MPATNAEIGFETTLGIESATPGTYDIVSEVTSITPPSMQRDAVEATHLKSPNAHKEFIAGMIESGDATFGLNFIPSASDALVTAFNDGFGKFQITFPNSVTLTFDGLVTAYELGDVTNGKMTATMTIKPTAKPVWA